MTLLEVLVVLAVWCTAGLVLSVVVCTAIHWMGTPDGRAHTPPDAAGPALPEQREAGEQVAGISSRRQAL